MPAMMSPDQIKEFRTERKLSQSALAQSLGVDQATVSRAERGAPLPKSAELLLLRLMAEPAGEAA